MAKKEPGIRPGSSFKQGGYVRETSFHVKGHGNGEMLRCSKSVS